MLNDWPAWVPEDARRYIAHTEGGQGIRDLARECGCHASTISRQVRRIEARRDDPLIDAALSRLGGRGKGPARGRRRCRAGRRAWPAGGLRGRGNPHPAAVV
ncbi:helix-turn-helix domain-containing protein [Jhaorihella thermophila]